MPYQHFLALIACARLKNKPDSANQCTTRSEYLELKYCLGSLLEMQACCSANADKDNGLRQNLQALPNFNSKRALPTVVQQAAPFMDSAKTQGRAQGCLERLVFLFFFAFGRSFFRGRCFCFRSHCILFFRAFSSSFFCRSFLLFDYRSSLRRWRT